MPFGPVEFALKCMHTLDQTIRCVPYNDKILLFSIITVGPQGTTGTVIFRSNKGRRHRDKPPCPMIAVQVKDQSLAKHILPRRFPQC